MEVRIRKYKNKDLDSLDDILKDSFNVSRKGKKSNNIEFVACIGDKVVGYVVVNKCYDTVKDINYFQLNYVCVHSDYRNMGVGKKLLEEVFLLAKRKNISYIELTSNKKRLEAHCLYEKNGFVVRDTDVFRKEII